MYARATGVAGGLNTSRLKLTRFLRQPWDNKPYRSWPKLGLAEVIKCAAVDAALFYYPYR
jgi:hypothetical protein